MKALTKTFLFGTVLGGITLFGVEAVIDTNAFLSVYTYLLFVAIITTVARMGLLKNELGSQSGKSAMVNALITFSLGFFIPYAILFYFISKAVSNISIF